MRWYVALLLAVGATRFTGPAFQAPPSTFVTMIGADTTIVETFTRTATTITSDLRLLRPHQSRVHYTVYLHDDGTADRVEFREEAAEGFVQYHITFGADSLRESGSTNGRGFGAALPTSGRVYAHLPVSYALLESLVRATHPAVGDSARIPVFNIRQDTGVTQSTIRKISADSVQIGANIRVFVAKNGDVTGGVNMNTKGVTTRR